MALVAALYGDERRCGMRQYVQAGVGVALSSRMKVYWDEIRVLDDLRSKKPPAAWRTPYGQEILKN